MVDKACTEIVIDDTCWVLGFTGQPLDLLVYSKQTPFISEFMTDLKKQKNLPQCPVSESANKVSLLSLMSILQFLSLLSKWNPLFCVDFNSFFLHRFVNGFQGNQGADLNM